MARKTKEMLKQALLSTSSELDDLENDFEIVLPKEDTENKLMKKNAASIDISPASILSVLSGYLSSKYVADKQRQIKDRNVAQQKLGPDYYSQVDNLMEDLDIVFTPFSVLFVVNGLTVDVLDTSDMTEEMRVAWSERNKDYFKNLLVNKMNMEIQLAEQMFARSLIDRNMQLKDRIDKMASLNSNSFDSEDDSSFVKKCSSSDVYGYVDGIIDLTKNLGKSDKFFSFMVKEAQDICDEELEIPLSLSNIKPFDKTAEFFGSKILSFLGLGPRDNISLLQKKMYNPGYIYNNVDIRFFPDRVLFVLDDETVFAQLSNFGMDEHAFERFREQDADYFKDLLLDKMKDGFTAWHDSDEDLKSQEKQASKADNRDPKYDLFSQKDIHPKIYYLALMDRFNSDWINWEVEVLIKNIEEEFGLSEEIRDVPLNKILFLQLICKKQVEIVEDYHLFEKCIRSFNNKDVDFVEREPVVSLGEFLVGLRIIDDIGDIQDIFGEMSDRVYDYIVEMLMESKYRAVNHLILTESESEKEFSQDLNTSLFNSWNAIECEDVFDSDEKSLIRERNKTMQIIIIKIVDIFREKKFVVDEDMVLSMVDKFLDKLDIKEDYIIQIISLNVVMNLASDMYLKKTENSLDEQLELYNQVINSN